MTAAQAIGFARQVLDEVSQPIEGDMDIGHGVALLALARCRALLDGMLSLAKDDKLPVTGVVSRSLYETWLTGVYALGGDDAVEALERNRLYWAGQLDPDALVDSVLTQAKLSTYELARRASQVMTDRLGADVTSPMQMYKSIYAVESYRDVHGGLGTLNSYVAPQGEKVMRVLYERDEPSTVPRFIYCSLLVLWLANMIRADLGLDTQPLDNLALAVAPTGNSFQ